jgi:hypothetical protein
MQISADGTLLRSLPNPLTASDTARIRDARPAGPPPSPATEPLRVQRRVGSRGALVIAGQRIQVGIGHAGRTLIVEDADTTFRVYDGAQLVTEVIRTTARQVARFKADEGRDYWCDHQVEAGIEPERQEQPGDQEQHRG